MNEPNEIYTIKSYLDKDGKEIEELTSLTNNKIKYVGIYFLPIPSGPSSFALIRTRIPLKDVKNIADAMNKYDEQLKEIERNMEAQMQKPSLAVPKSAGGLIIP